MCLDRQGFQAIPHISKYEDKVMMVVVEGWKPQCWHCKQLGHFSRSCPQKTTKPTSSPPTSPPLTTTTTTTTAAATTRPNTETGDQPNKGVEGWTQVTRNQKKKSPLKAPINETTTVTPGKKSTKEISEKPTSPSKTSQKKKKRKKHINQQKPQKAWTFTST